MSIYADPIARYTDGTPVQVGDSIRYHQTPGGIMAPGPWKYGTAAYLPWSPDQMALEYAPGRYCGIISHIIERA